MDAGVDMMLFPLSAFRASSKAAEKVYESILKKWDAGKCFRYNANA